MTDMSMIDFTHVDKNSAKHFGINVACPMAGALLGALIGLLIGLHFGTVLLDVLLGIVVGQTAGSGIGFASSVTKEWCDDIFYGHWCWWDFTFDLLGMLAGNIIPLVIVIVFWRF